MTESLDVRKTRFSFESTVAPELANPQSLASVSIALSDRADKLAILADNVLYILNGTLELARPMSPVLGENGAFVSFAGLNDSPTQAIWLTHQVVGVGFRSGCIRCYDTQGVQICIHQPHNTRVQSLRKKTSLTTEAGRPSAFAASLWVLYEGGILVSIPIYALAAEMSPSEVPYQLFKLLQQSTVTDFVLGGESYLPLGEYYPDKILNNIFVGGQGPTLAMYHIGGPRHFQTLGKLATYVKERVTTAVSKALGGFFASPKAGDQVREQVPCTSVLEFEDPERMVERVSVDPLHKLIVTTDALGRVILFDARTMVAIRMWKGIRDALFAWHETISGHTSYGVDIPVLCLIIHAPRTGLITLWAMRHGPCLHTIPIGPYAQVFTVFEHRSNKRQAKCGILHADGTKINLELLDMAGGLHVESPAAEGGEADSEASTLDEALSPQTPSEGSGAEPRALAVISATLGIQTSSAKLDGSSGVFTRVQLPDDIESRIWDEVVKISTPHGLLRLLSLLEDSSKITLSILLYRKIFKQCEEVAIATNSKKLLAKSTNRARLLDAYVTLLDVSPPPPPVVVTQIERSWGGNNNWRQEALVWGSRVLHVEVSEHMSVVDNGGQEIPRGDYSVDKDQPLEEADDDGFHDAAGDVQVGNSNSSNGRRRNRTTSSDPGGTGHHDPAKRLSFNVYNVLVPFEDFCLAFTEPSDEDGVFTIRQAFQTSIIELSQLKWDLDTSSPFATQLIPSTSSSDEQLLFLQKATHALCLVLRPLLCDVFAIQSFAKAMTTLKLPSNDILGLLGPFLSMLSMPVLFASLMSRPKTSCPWQRWLKEVISDILGLNDNSKSQTLENSRQTRQSRSSASSPSKKYFSRKGSGDDLAAIAQGPKSTFGEATQWSPVTSGSAAGGALTVHTGATSSVHVAAFLKPLLLHIRAWRQLEHAFLIGSMVVEVLESLSQQLEKRTYGEEDLTLSIKQWCTVLRQLRVALLLSCREDAPVTVSALDDGDPSIFRLLAKDTLRFAINPEQALTHEIRCQELIASRATAKDKNSKPVVAAWDPHNDQRWQELLAIVQTEDESPMLSGKGNPQARRRPLLLYFPAHNQPHILGAHRAMLLAERWVRRPTRSAVLPTAIMHMEPLPPFTRAGAALWMWTLVVAPFLRGCWVAATTSTRGPEDIDRNTKYLPRNVVANVTAAEDIFQAGMDLLTPMQLSDMGFMSTTPPRTPLPDVGGAELDDPDSISCWPKDKDQPVNRWTKTIREASVVPAAIQAHRTALLLMLVRAQARLHESVAELVPSAPVIDELFQPHTLQHPSPAVVASTLEQNDRLKSRQKSFLAAAFLGIGPGPSHAAYRLAEAWSIPLQQVRSLHISALIAVGFDELAAEIMTKVDDISEISGSIIQTVRQRLGYALLTIEKNPAYAMLLASLDADICEWVRAKVRPKGTEGRSTGGIVNLTNFTATRNLLLRLTEVLRSDTKEHQQVVGLLTMCTSLSQTFG